MKKNTTIQTTAQETPSFNEAFKAEFKPKSIATDMVIAGIGSIFAMTMHAFAKSSGLNK